MPNVSPLFKPNDDRAARQSLWTDPPNTLQALVNDFRAGRRKADQIVVIFPDLRLDKVSLIQHGYTRKQIKKLLTDLAKTL